MSEETLTATPYAVHIPDEYSTQEKRDGADWELGAGHYEFGFEVNGARFPLARLKGGGVQKKLAAAKARNESQQSATQAQPSEQQQQLQPEQQPQEGTSGTAGTTAWGTTPPQA